MNKEMKSTPALLVDLKPHRGTSPTSMAATYRATGRALLVLLLVAAAATSGGCAHKLSNYYNLDKYSQREIADLLIAYDRPGAQHDLGEDVGTWYAICEMTDQKLIAEVAAQTGARIAGDAVDRLRDVDLLKGLESGAASAPTRKLATERLAELSSDGGKLFFYLLPRVAEVDNVHFELDSMSPVEVNAYFANKVRPILLDVDPSFSNKVRLSDVRMKLAVGARHTLTVHAAGVNRSSIVTFSETHEGRTKTTAYSPRFETPPDGARVEWVTSPGKNYVALLKLAGRDIEFSVLEVGVAVTWGCEDIHFEKMHSALREGKVVSNVLTINSTGQHDVDEREIDSNSTGQHRK